MSCSPSSGRFASRSSPITGWTRTGRSRTRRPGNRPSSADSSPTSTTSGNRSAKRRRDDPGCGNGAGALPDRSGIVGRDPRESRWVRLRRDPGHGRPLHPRGHLRHPHARGSIPAARPERGLYGRVRGLGLERKNRAAPDPPPLFRRAELPPCLRLNLAGASASESSL